MWHVNDPGWGWWLLMSVGMVAFWGLLLYGAIWLARGKGATTPPPPAEPPASAEPPQQILKRRLAAGDIGVEEYDRLRAALDDEPAKPPPEPALR